MTICFQYRHLEICIIYIYIDRERDRERGGGGGGRRRGGGGQVNWVCIIENKNQITSKYRQFQAFSTKSNNTKMC